MDHTIRDVNDGVLTRVEQARAIHVIAKDRVLDDHPNAVISRYPRPVNARTIVLEETMTELSIAAQDEGPAPGIGVCCVTIANDALVDNHPILRAHSNLKIGRMRLPCTLLGNRQMPQ